MEILKYNIFKLLNHNNKIKIPFFQRQYVWTFKEQISTLLNDINNCKSNYYLGNIIFKHENGKSNRLIIDGQQRITTFLILLSVIKNEFDYSSEIFQEIKRILSIFEFDSFYVNNKYALSKIIKSKLNEISSEEENTRYYQNYQDIKKHLENYFNTEEKLTSLINKIENVEFAQITVDNETNENILFSQINSTGIKLSQYDLFKNHILTKLIDDAKLNNNFDEDQIEKWVAKLDKINNSIDNDKKESDELLRSFIAWKTYSLCSAEKIYSVYVKHEKDIFSDIVKTFNEYCNFGFYYKYIVNKEYEKDFDWSTFQFIIEEFKTYSSLIIYILEQFSKIENDKIVITDKQSLLESIKIVDYYIISRKFSPNTQDKVITRKIPAFIKDIVKIKEELPNLSIQECIYLVMIWIPINKSKMLKEQLKYRASESKELKDFFITENIYGKNKKFTKNFLIKVAKLTDSKMDNSFNEKWTIEHVLPQNLEKWINNGYSDEDYSKLNTIGNLTLTKYNSELSNEIFSVKKEELSKKEGFILNNYFMDLDDWNNNEIIKRSEYFYNLFINNFDVDKIYSNIFNKYNGAYILEIKLSSVESEKLENTEKNLVHFKRERIDKDTLIKLIKQYYLTKSGPKAELAVFNRPLKGWVINSIKHVITFDFEKYPDVNEFIEIYNDKIDEYLANIERIIDEKNY